MENDDVKLESVEKEHLWKRKWDKDEVKDDDGDDDTTSRE